MVNQELVDSVNLIRIILFVYVNFLYIYVAIRLWKRKIDKAAKIILLLFFLVFFIEFISAVFANSEGYVFSIFSVSCYITIQLAAILILHETKRVKMIITSKSSIEYEDGVKKLQL